MARYGVRLLRSDLAWSNARGLLELIHSGFEASEINIAKSIKTK